MKLTVSDLSLSFGNKLIFQGLTFEINAGEIACLLGSSGCGKTTALRCILGFETPQSGQICLDNTPLFNQHTALPAHKRGIGMVFQDYALLPHLTVADNICFGIVHLDKSAQRSRLTELLDLIGLSDYAHHYPHELSGGQQQRIALARALAPRPKLILLDEPFSNLDVELRANLSKEVRQLLKAENVSAILVTHDQSEAFAMADVIGVIGQGQLQQWGSPVELYQRPSTKVVAEFIGDGILINIHAIHPTMVSCALGDIPCANTQNASRNSQILIRPEHIHIGTTGVTAQITQKDFQGERWRYHLKLDDGTTIIAYSPIYLSYHLKDTVHISATQGWLVQ